MIAPGKRIITRNQRKAAQAKMQEAVKKQAEAQITINAVMWQIIKEHAEDPDGDAVLKVPIEEFKDVPALFNLDVSQDETHVLIKASVKEPVEEKRIIRLHED